MGTYLFRGRRTLPARPWTTTLANAEWEFLMTARDKVAEAIHECIDTADTFEEIADAAIAAYRDALKAEGCVIMRPVTAWEEATNEF